MIKVDSEPASRIVLAVDTSDIKRAVELMEIARKAGAKTVKLGLELATAVGWLEASKMADGNGLEWVADAKLSDIPNTTAKAAGILVGLEHPPVAITMHTNSGIDSMRAARQQVEESATSLLGVTVLTSITPEECQEMYGRNPSQSVQYFAEQAREAGVEGVVASPRELTIIKNFTPELFTMIPGTRSEGASRDDQSRTATPTDAIARGADTLVIGRQVTNAEDPDRAFSALTKEISLALKTIK